MSKIRSGWLVMACLALVGCGGGEGEGVAPSDETPTGAGVGASCVEARECRPGLSCAGGTCQPAGTTAQGKGCRISAECASGLYCDAAAGSCQPAGTTAADAACGSTAECAPGLACELQGFGGVCAARGQSDEGQACETDSACFAGLTCQEDAEGRTCAGGLGSLPRPWPGVTCAVDTGPLRGYFEVPGGPTPLADFYRLPLPNDLRLNLGRPVLTGHPTPGAAALGVDLTQLYLDRIQAEQDHWGLNQAVLFRFSGRVDFGETSLVSGGESPTIYMVDITPGSEEYNERQPIYWQASTSGSAYICDNWISMRPTWGRPLQARTTYAAIVTTGVRGVDGAQLGQDAGMAAMLGATRPGEAHLGSAWDQHTGLRLWLAEQGIDPASIAVASVFTTGDPRQVTRGLRAVARAEVPAATELTTCASGVRSPCDDGLEGAAHQRGCQGTPAGMVEVQGKLLLPIVQRGAPPYLESGGGVEFAGGAPVLQRQEEVCFAMTAPEGEAPAAGWPVLITAHGTGGSFRSHVETLAPLVTGVEVGGQRLDMLTIGWDQVQHFTRRGDSTLDPEALVYNFGNPDAARGNVWQSAVDLHAIVRFVEALDLEVDGRRIKADPSQLYFLGHSQGGTSGAIALPYEPLIRGAVLSGTGAGLTLSLQAKTSPVNIPGAVSAALQDPMVGESHPVLNLLQGWFDPVDPLNYAEHIGARQLEGETSPRHVFALIGLGDTYAPQPTLEVMATAMRATLVEPLRGELSRGFAATAPAPVQGNASIGGVPYTVVTRQYLPAAYDGHFVLFRHPDAQGDLQEFLSSALQGVPMIRD